MQAARFSPARPIHKAAGLFLAAALVAAAPWAALAQAPVPVQTPPQMASTVSAEQAARALEHAMQYALFRYQADGEEKVGVPYRLGGRVTLEEFARLAQSDPQQAAQTGIDASGLVVNAYAAAIPGLRFFTGPTGQEPLAGRVSSSALFRWNTRPVTLEEVRPGDLLFFRSPATGQISGVALVSERVGNVLRVVVASESRGRVTEIGIRTDADYWKSRVAGLGRLVYAQAAVPAQTP